MKFDLKKEISLPKLSKPKLGRPSLPGKPKSINAAPSRRTPDIKVPKIVGDLYGDLRDRHLLPLVLVLIVAIIGAPIVLGNTGGGDEPSAAPIVSSGEAHDSAFAVVPAEESLRSPGKRLGHRHALNPFRTETPSAVVQSDGGQRAKVPTAPQQASGSTVETSTTEVSSETVPSESPPVVSPPVENAPPEPQPSPNPPTETRTKTESTTKESSSETTAPQVPQYAVNLKAGFDPEKLLPLEDVQPMTRLPSDKNPAILYVGLSQDQKHGLFLLTTKVTAYYGAARCVLDKLSCELVELDPGKSATFEIGLGEEATRYKVLFESLEPVEPEADSAKRTTTRTETHSTDPTARSLAIGNAHFSK